jgi:hypothetical protein
LGARKGYSFFNDDTTTATTLTSTVKMKKKIKIPLSKNKKSKLTKSYNKTVYFFIKNIYNKIFFWLVIYKTITTTSSLYLSSNR